MLQEAISLTICLSANATVQETVLNKVDLIFSVPMS